jgi:hypothetical protein
MLEHSYTRHWTLKHSSTRTLKHSNTRTFEARNTPERSILNAQCSNYRTVERSHEYTLSRAFLFSRVMNLVCCCDRPLHSVLCPDESFSLFHVVSQLLSDLHKEFLRFQHKFLYFSDEISVMSRNPFQISEKFSHSSFYISNFQSARSPDDFWIGFKSKSFKMDRFWSIVITVFTSFYSWHILLHKCLEIEESFQFEGSWNVWRRCSRWGFGEFLRQKKRKRFRSNFHDVVGFEHLEKSIGFLWIWALTGLVCVHVIEVT